MDDSTVDQEARLEDASETSASTARHALGGAGQPDASYLLLFRSNPQPMFVYDVATLGILDVNEAALVQYGYSREEFLALDLTALRPGEEVARFLGHLQELRPDYSPPRDEWRHRRKNGQSFYVDVSAHSTRYAGHAARLVMASDVSARKRAQEALKCSEERYRILAEHIPDCDLYLFDRSGRFVLADGTEMSRLSLSKDEILGKTPRELFGADTAAALERLFDETVAGRQAEVELSFRGHIYSIRTTPIRDQGERYAGMAIMQNVTAQKRQEAQLERLARFRSELVDFFDESLRFGPDESFYARLLDRAVRLIPGAEAGSLLLSDEGGRYRFVAAVGFDLAGLAQVSLAAHELYGDPQRLEPQIVMGLPEREIGGARGVLLERYGRLGEIHASLVTPIVYGGRTAAFLSLNAFDPLRSFDGEALEMARAFAQPVAVLLQRRALEAELLERQHALEKLANYDALTGLPNRLLFYDRLGEALKFAKRSGEAAGVLYADLDGFKRVNDSWGHQVGDRLLQAVATRLGLCVRENDTVARLGGDEFVFILNGLKSPDHAPLVARKVLDSLVQPFLLEVGPGLKEEVAMSASVGVAVYPRDAQDAEALIRAADAAMYRAKAMGNGKFRVFAPA